MAWQQGIMCAAAVTVSIVVTTAAATETNSADTQSITTADTNAIRYLHVTCYSSYCHLYDGIGRCIFLYPNHVLSLY